MQIQDLETKGQPFSNIADVFDHQPRLTLSEEGRRRPNQGRKILAFSTAVKRL